jgi:hypothetical protein
VCGSRVEIDGVRSKVLRRHKPYVGPEWAASKAMLLLVKLTTSSKYLTGVAVKFENSYQAHF